MVVPEAGRDIGAVVGALLVITAAGSVIGTIIVPRPVGSWLTKLVDRLVNGTFRVLTGPISDYRTRDRVLAAQAPTILLIQLIAWLGIFFVGYALLLWPFVPQGITTAFTTASPALWEIGSEEIHGAAIRTILDMASLTGLVTITLQIAYLPTLYSAFNRRETEVALLNARAGVRRGVLNCSRARTSRSGPALLPSTRCLACTSCGSASRRTSPRVTRPTCHWSGSGRPGRCRRG